MMATPHTEQGAFLAARHMAEPVERAAFLASLDGRLADRVAALLAVEDSFLGQPAPGLAPAGTGRVLCRPLARSESDGGKGNFGEDVCELVVALTNK